MAGRYTKAQVRERALRLAREGASEDEIDSYLAIVKPHIIDLAPETSPSDETTSPPGAQEDDLREPIKLRGAVANKPAREPEPIELPGAVATKPEEPPLDWLGRLKRRAQQFDEMLATAPPPGFRVPHGLSEAITAGTWATPEPINTAGRVAAGITGMLERPTETALSFASAPLEAEEKLGRYAEQQFPENSRVRKLSRATRVLERGHEAPVSDEEGAIAAAQLAAMGIAGPLTEMLGGPGVTVASKIAGPQTLRELAGTSVPEALARAFGTRGAPVVARAVPASLIGATFMPEDPVAGAGVGAVLGGAHAAVSGARSRLVAPAVEEPIWPVTSTDRLLGQRAPAPRAPTASVRMSNQPPAEEPAAQPESIMETLRKAAAERDANRKPTGSTPEPVAPTDMEIPVNVEQPKAKKPVIAYRVSPIEAAGARFSRTAPDAAAVPYNIADLNIADADDPNTALAIIDEATRDPQFNEEKKAELAELAAQPSPLITHEMAPLFATAAKRLGYDGLQPTDDEKSDEPPPTLIWNIRKVKPGPASASASIPSDEAEKREAVSKRAAREQEERDHPYLSQLAKREDLMPSEKASMREEYLKEAARLEAERATLGNARPEPRAEPAAAGGTGPGVVGRRPGPGARGEAEALPGKQRPPRVRKGKGAPAVPASAGAEGQAAAAVKTVAVRDANGRLRRNLRDVPTADIADEILRLGDAIGEDNDAPTVVPDENFHTFKDGRDWVGLKPAAIKASGRNKARRQAMHRLTEEINRRGENAEDVLDASIERYREREAMRDEDKRHSRNAGGDEEEVAPGVVFERGPKYEGSNPFRKRAIAARARAGQLGKPTAHERGMEHSFPLGGGYGRKGGEARIESSINRSVEAVKAHKDAAYYEAQADAYDRGEINAQGRAINKESQARSEKREAAAEKREKRIAAAKERRGDKERWQVPGTVWADSAGYLGGGGRELILGEHRDAVDEAIREGKPVPDDVLAEHNEARGRASEPATSYEAKPKHEFSSTQLDLPEEVASEVKKLAADIPEEDLAKDGREDQPHITVKYGLHTESADKLRELLANEKPITVTFREASFFPNGESDAGDVLKVDIRSPALRALNKKIAAAEPHTDTHPGFKPHATIAYLKPGLGKKYAGKTALTGKSITLHELTFSDKNGETVKIPLGVKSRSRAAELEERYGTDEAMGVTEGREGAELPDGGRAAICTDCARFVVQREGGQVVGWEEGANPTATVNDPKLGHDFAIVDGRYIVDPWAKNTAGTSPRAVYDLRSSADKPEIARLYGDRRKWVDLESDAPYGGRVSEKDMFGYDANAEPEQESMFGGKEGTAAARNLEQTERASRNELEKLKARQAAKPASLLEQTRIAKRIAELEKLVNRNKAISADEMATRAKGEQEEAPPPTRRAKTDDEQSALFERGPAYMATKTEQVDRLPRRERAVAYVNKAAEAWRAMTDPSVKTDLAGEDLSRAFDYAIERATKAVNREMHVGTSPFQHEDPRYVHPDALRLAIMGDSKALGLWAHGQAGSWDQFVSEMRRYAPTAVARVLTLGYWDFADYMDVLSRRKRGDEAERQFAYRADDPVAILEAHENALKDIGGGGTHINDGLGGARGAILNAIAALENEEGAIEHAVKTGDMGRVHEDSPEYRAGRRTAAIPRTSPLVVSRKYISDEYKGHPDFAAAKAGDKESAVRFVKAMVDPATVRRARLKFGRNAVYVAPVAIERGGTNAIPQMLAEHYAAEAGGRTDQEIVQATRAYHTGADMMSRIVSPPAFNGAVEKGAKYLLVDDVLMSGGTIAQLADYIQKQGGQVVGVVALANASRSGELHPSKVTLRALERRFGDVIRDEFGIDPKALTRDEADYLIGFRTADELRNRAAKAREERTERLRRGSVQEKAPPETGQVRETSGPYEGRSRFYSRLARALDAAPFEKGTPEQWRAQLSKNVPKGEVEWTKIDKYLETEGPSITKAELKDLFQRNRIKLDESVGSGKDTPAIRAAAEASEKAQSLTRVTARQLENATIMAVSGRAGDKSQENAALANIGRVGNMIHWDEYVRNVEDALGGPKLHRRVRSELAQLAKSLSDAREAETAARMRHNQLTMGASGAKWETYTEPGGENYREIKIQFDISNPADDRAPDFESGHFDEPNILVSVRANDRTLPNGEKVLFVEEIQSDWHEQGRDRGYAVTSKLDWKEVAPPPAGDYAYYPRAWEAKGPDGRTLRIIEVQGRDSGRTHFVVSTDSRGLAMNLEDAKRAVADDLAAKGVPDAPFKRSEEWGKLALRRVLDEAVAGGYDRIGWTTGQQQVARYDLSKHVQWIKWRADKNGTVAIDALPIESDGDPREMLQLGIKPEDLPNTIGKELARQVKEQIANGETEGDFSGDDLKVGGHGMLAFYDEMIPKFAKEVGKELGVKIEIEPVKMEFGEGGPHRWEGVAGSDRWHMRDVTDADLEEFAGFIDENLGEGEQADTVDDAISTLRADLKRGKTFDWSMMNLPPRFRKEVADYMEIHRVPNRVDQHTIKITPELKQAIEEKGLRLMERGGKYNPDQLSLFAKAAKDPEGREAAKLEADEQLVAFGSTKAASKVAEEMRNLNARLDRLDPAARREVVQQKDRAEKAAGFVDLRGRKFGPSIDHALVADAIAPFRSPRMERLHAIVVDADGTGLAHTIETSGQVNFVALANDARWAVELAQRVRRVGGTRVILAHNHPSGDPTASGLDKGFTENIGYRLQQEGVELAGHLVIDHHEFEWMEPNEVGNVDAERGTYAPPKDADWTSRRRTSITSGSAAFAELSRSGALDPNGVTVLMLDTQNQAVALVPYNADAIPKIAQWLPQHLRAHAASQAILAGGPDSAPALLRYVSSARRDPDSPLHDVLDILAYDTDGLHGRSYAATGQYAEETPYQWRQRFRRLADKRPARRLGEEGPAYVPSADAGADASERDVRSSSAVHRGERGEEADRVAEPSPPYESLKTAAEKVAAAKDDIQQLLAPPSRGGKPTRRAASVIRHRLGEMARENERAVEALKAARNAMFGLPVAERWKWNDDMEHGHMIAQQKMRDLGRVVRKALDDTRDEVRALGKGALEQYIENYMPHIYKQPSKFQDMVRKILGKRPLQGPKSFLKKRSIEYMKDAMAMGFEPVSDNPIDLVLLRLREMRRYIFAQRMWTDMKQRGLVKFVRVGRDLPDGYAKIDDALATVFAPRDTEGAMRIRGYWVAPEPIARLLNNHLRPGLRGHALYDLWNWAGNLMNSVQLGFSAFHLGFTSLDASISKGALAIEQMQSGKPLRALSSAAQAASIVIPPITNVIRGDRVLQEYLHPGSNPAFADMVDAVTKAGGRVRMDSMYRMGHLAKLMDAVRELRQKPATKTLAIALHAPFAVIEASMYPILEVIVPRQKLGVFADLASHALERLRAKGASPDEIQQELAKIWDSVDNRMGQLVYDNLFWSRTVKDLALITTRSVGWNWGTAREVGGGVGDVAYNIADVIRGKKTRLSYRTQYLLALFGITAIAGAILNYLYTGEAPKEIKDYFYPRTGRKDKNGNDDRMALPGYLKDLVSYWRHPMQTLGHKLHPLLAVASEVMHNRDYYGNMIRNEDAPTDEQLAQSIHFWWEQARPFSVQGAIEAGKRGEPVSRRVGSFVGLTPAAREIVRTPAENKLYELMARRGHTAMTPEQVEASQKRRDMKTDLRDARLSGDTAEARSLIAGVRAAKKSGEVSRRQMQDIVRSSRKRALEMNFKQLSYEDALKVYELADPEERAMWYPLLHRKAQNTGHGRAFMQLNIQRPAVNQ